jgi:hypothetical protein
MSDHRDTVVVKDGGSSAGILLALVVILVVLAAGWYFLLGPGAGSAATPSDVNVNVTLPSVGPDAS